MINKRDLERAVLAQRQQLNHAQIGIGKTQGMIEELKDKQMLQYKELEDFESQLNRLLDLVDAKQNTTNCSSTLEVMTVEEKEAITERVMERFQGIRTIDFDDMESYIESVDKYLEDEQFDLKQDPLMQLFDSEHLHEMLDYYNQNYGKLTWSKLDYMVIGTISVLSVLIDIFIVSIPEDMNFLGKDYKGSPVTKKLKEVTVSWYEGTSNSKLGKWMNKALQTLEDYAQVPYDIATNQKIDLDGLSPWYHRYMSLGHDPILGFIFGVLDLMRGTMTCIDKNGILKIIKVGDGGVGIFSAFLKVFCHLLSDIFTKMGIAPPFLSLLQLCTGKSPFILKKNGEKVTFNHVARFMYKHGYDMRHMLTMGIQPLFIEISIRTYYNLSYFDSLLDHEKDIRHKCKKNNMLLLTHSISMSGNVFKMWLMGWNPTAFNYTEFLVLIKSVICAAKSNRDYHKELDEMFVNRWKEIIAFA